MQIMEIPQHRLIWLEALSLGLWLVGRAVGTAVTRRARRRNDEFGHSDALDRRLKIEWNTTRSLPGNDHLSIAGPVPEDPLGRPRLQKRPNLGGEVCYTVTEQMRCSPGEGEITCQYAFAIAH